MASVKWALDPSHSEFQFKIRHLMITNVSGTFGQFAVDVETEELDFSTAKIGFTAETATVSTKNEQRDGHLKSADFFNAEKYPQIRFTSTSVTRVDDENYKLAGNLTMLEVTKPVVLTVEYGGTITDPWGNTRAGFTVEGKVNRKEFGLTWNAPTEAGGLVLSEDVKLHATIEVVKQA